MPHILLSKPRRKELIQLAAAAFLVGIISETFWQWQIITIILICVSAILFISVRQWRFAVIIVVVAFLVGMGRIMLEPRAPTENNIGSFATTRDDPLRVEIMGRLSRFPDYRFDKEKWVLTAKELTFANGESKSVKGKMLFQIPSGNGLEYGDIIILRGNLEIPFETDEFSYKNYLARTHIYAVMNYPQVEKTGKSVSNPVMTPLFRLRQWFDRSLKRAIPAPESAFAAGILIGDRSGFSPEYEEAFRKTGLSHLLALSGYNITIIVLAVFWLLKWFGKRIRLTITMAFLVFFVIFVGGGSSIIRAAVMGAIGLFVVHSGRNAHGLTLLLLASVLMVTISPLILAFDPSFQLSFAGVLGLIGFATPIKQFVNRKIHNLFWTELLAATLAAQLGVMPLLLSLFGAISLIAPIANLLIAPLVPIQMLLSFLAIFPGAFIGFIGSLIAFAAWNLLHVSLVVIKLLATIPGASVEFQTKYFGTALTIGLIWLPLLLKKIMKSSAPANNLSKR